MKYLCTHNYFAENSSLNKVCKYHIDLLANGIRGNENQYCLKLLDLFLSGILISKKKNL